MNISVYFKTCKLSFHMIKIERCTIFLTKNASDNAISFNKNSLIIYCGCQKFHIIYLSNNCRPLKSKNTTDNWRNHQHKRDMNEYRYFEIYACLHINKFLNCTVNSNEIFN